MKNSELIDYFFTEYNERFADETKRTYRLALEEFFSYCPKNFAEVTAKDIRAWLADLDAKGQKPRTLNHKLAALKTLYKFCQEQEHKGTVLLCSS